VIASIPQTNTQNNPPGQILLSIDAIVIASASVVLMGVGMLLKYFITKSLKDYETRLEHIEGALEEQKKFNLQRITEINEFKQIFAQQYVHREDWVRSAAAMDAKLDAVHRRLDRLIEMQMSRRAEDE
jgi:hypothetical protein